MLKSEHLGQLIINQKDIYCLTAITCLYIANKLQRPSSQHSILISDKFRQKVAELKYPQRYLFNAQRDILVTINFRCHLSILKPLLKIFIGKIALEIQDERFIDQTKLNDDDDDDEDEQISLNMRHGLILKAIEEISSYLLLQCLYSQRLTRMDPYILIATVISCSIRSFKHNCKGISKLQSKIIVKDYKRVSKMASISQQYLMKSENYIKQTLEGMIQQNPELKEAENLFKQAISQIKQNGI